MHQEWEYFKVVGMDAIPTADLNVQGKAGWELVAMCPGQAKLPPSNKYPEGQIIATVLGIFKRPVSRIINPGSAH